MTKYIETNNFSFDFAYNEHVNKLGYQGTYLEWIKNQIESSGIYMPIGMGGKWNQ